MKLTDQYPTLRQYVSALAASSKKTRKVIAHDMGLSESMLSRKLNPGEKDSQRLSVDNLEEFIESTGFAEQIIDYLEIKYCDQKQGESSRAASAMIKQAISQLEDVLPLLNTKED